MTVGKAIYYLLSNYSDLTDIVSTRIYPEVAEQDAAMPFVIYTVVSNEPSDTQSSPSQLDIAQVDIVLFSTDYSQVVDMGVAARAALDRVTGTYNGVNVQSCQYTSEVIDFEEYPRAYVITQSYDVRINRDEFEIAQGTPVSGANIIDLADTPNNYGTTGQALVVNADGDGMEWGEGGGAAALPNLTDVNDEITADAIDRQGVVYDEATGEWIAGGVSQTTIPIRNSSATQLNKGAVVAFAGTQGDRILVEIWDNASASAYIVGVLEANLAGSADGHAISYGEVRALDTSAYALNDVLHASAGGTFTTVPNSLPIATVTRVHANTGRIFVRTYVPGDHYRDRYRAEASAKVTAASLAAGETVETYYTAQADGDAFYRRKLSDTARNEGDVVRRTYYYKSGSFGNVTTTGYTEVVMADDSTHDELIAAIQTHLNTNAAPLTVWSKRAEVTPPENLLDDFPGAAVAFSAARLLRSDYTGAAINVRRASDNAVQDIGFDGDGELDTSALATFCAGTNGFVVRWYDQSGNGNDATQAATSEQPKVYDSGTGIITKNGKPAVETDGTNDVLETAGVNCASNFQLALVGATLSGGFGYFTNLASSDDGIEILNFGTSYRFSIEGNDDTIAITLGNQSVAMFAYDGTSKIYSINGTENVDALTTTVGVSAGLEFGKRIGSSPVNAVYQEFVLWNSDTHISNRAAIEANINDFYSIY
jgi:hypothetical protein